MDYKKLKKDINSKAELEEYLKTLPEEAREQVQEMLDNIEPRMIISEGVARLLMEVNNKYPNMKSDGLSVLCSMIAIAGTSNLDRLILHCLQKGGVIELIKTMLEGNIEEIEKGGLKDVLKGFKFNDN